MAGLCSKSSRDNVRCRNGGADGMAAAESQFVKRAKLFVSDFLAVVRIIHSQVLDVLPDYPNQLTNEQEPEPRNTSTSHWFDLVLPISRSSVTKRPLNLHELFSMRQFLINLESQEGCGCSTVTSTGVTALPQTEAVDGC